MHPRAPPCTLYSPLVCLSCDINLHLAENIEPDMIACARHLSLTLMARSPYALYALPFVSTALRRRALGELTAIHTNMRDSSNGHVGLSLSHWVMYMHAHVPELPESAPCTPIYP